MNQKYQNKHSIHGKRIIIVLGSLEMGGAERQALTLARYLIRDYGAKIQVWGFHTPGRIAEQCEEEGIPWRIVPKPKLRYPIIRLAMLIRFALTLRKEKPDIILPYIIDPNVICGLTWQWTDAKLCIWNQEDEGIGRLSHRLEQAAVRKTPLFISNSRGGKDFLIKSLNVDPSKIQVISNGIELKSHISNREICRKQLGLPEDCFVACMVANLSEYKDHVTLLKAWRIVCDQLYEKNLNAVLLLAGRFDSMYEKLTELSKEINLSDKVKFLGRVDDIPSLLCAVDLSVFSSFSEGCPNGVLECMEAGLPVVGTDIPGIRDAVGINGYPYLAPPKDYFTLADQILKFVYDPELRLKLGALNRHRVETKFSSKIMCEKTVDFLIRGFCCD